MHLRNSHLLFMFHTYWWLQERITSSRWCQKSIWPNSNFSQCDGVAVRNLSMNQKVESSIFSTIVKSHDMNTSHCKSQLNSLRRPKLTRIIPNLWSFFFGKYLYKSNFLNNRVSLRPYFFTVQNFLKNVLLMFKLCSPFIYIYCIKHY